MSYTLDELITTFGGTWKKFFNNDIYYLDISKDPVIWVRYMTYFDFFDCYIDVDDTGGYGLFSECKPEEVKKFIKTHTKLAAFK